MPSSYVIGEHFEQFIKGQLQQGRYVIFYLPVPGGVQIVRLLHGARDIEAAVTKPDADE